MKRLLILFSGLVLTVALVSRCGADIIPLTVDTNSSNVNLSVAGSADQSAVSGTVMFDHVDGSATSGNAQITALDLTLDDALTFTPFGLAGSTAAGDVMVSLVTPGAPGTISGGTFNQLQNLVALDGDIIAAGMTIDLSTVALAPVDFNNISVAQTGNVVTVGGSFEINETFEVLVGIFPLEINLIGTGQFEASGIKAEAIPEPGSLMVLLGMASVFLTRRRR